VSGHGSSVPTDTGAAIEEEDIADGGSDSGDGGIYSPGEPEE